MSDFVAVSSTLTPAQNLIGQCEFIQPRTHILNSNTRHGYLDRDIMYYWFIYAFD